MMAPWIISLLAATWFGWIGRKQGQNAFTWAWQGAFLALPSSTIVLGLCEASFIPMSHQQEVSFRFKSLILAVLPILIIGGIAMWVLRQRSNKQSAGQRSIP
jgi:hypothetical protein